MSLVQDSDGFTGDFMQLTRKFNSLLKPALEARDIMRRKVLGIECQVIALFLRSSGQEFWAQAARYRHKKFEKFKRIDLILHERVQNEQAHEISAVENVWLM